MKVFLTLLLCLLQFNAGAEEGTIHGVDYRQLFRYDFPHRGPIRYHVNFTAWYLHYADQGVRGLKPLNLSGTVSLLQKTAGKNIGVEAQVDLKWQKESQFWGLSNALELCKKHLVFHFSVSDTRVKTDHRGRDCPALDPLLEYILPMAYAPLQWPAGEIENWAGPNYMSHPQTMDLPIKTNETKTGTQQFMWIINTILKRPEAISTEVALIGEAHAEGVKYESNGWLRFSSPPKLGYVILDEIKLEYANTAVLSYPADLGKLKNFSLYLRRL